MATLPKPIDYGARPSLRSSRVDIPGQGELASGEALVQAVDTFNRVMEERKGKEDRLNYALARNELQQADLAGREALKDDEDWATFDERYSESYNTARDEVFERYKLNPHDRAILSSESDLIRERGRVQVGDYGRTVEIDESMARLNAGLAAARESISVEQDPETRNQILIGQLDAINAAEEKGHFGDGGDVKAEALRQKFAQDAAMSSLVNMDPKEREKLLEASLTYRNMVGPITVDDIREGKGSGSIADFLHADTAKKLLNETRKENKIDDEQRAGYAASDESWRLYPEPEQSAEREAHIREATKDSSGARKDGLSATRQRTASQVAADSLVKQELINDLMAEIDAGETFSGLSSEARAKLTSTELKLLDAYSISVHERDGFADYDTWEATTLWDSMGDAERAATDLDGFMPTENGDQVTWRQMLSRGKLELMSAQKRLSEQALKSGAVESGQTQTQLLHDALIASDFFDHKPTRTDPKADQDRWARISTAYDRALVAEGVEGKLSPTRRREILADVLKFEVWVRDADKGTLWDSDKIMKLAALNEAQMKDSYLKLDQPIASLDGKSAATMNIEFGSYSGPALTWLKNMGQGLNLGEPVDEKTLEEAWFYLVTDGFDAAIRRLAGDERY